MRVDRTRALLYATRWWLEKAAPCAPRALEIGWAAAHQVFLLLFSCYFLKDFQIWTNMKSKHFSNLNKFEI
jgi:hypothetical protein